MKKIIGLILVIAIALLVACAETTETDTQNNYIQDEAMFEIYVNEETGVNYIKYWDMRAGGLTVRLNADGTPYVSEVE